QSRWMLGAQVPEKRHVEVSGQRRQFSERWKSLRLAGPAVRAMAAGFAARFSKVPYQLICLAAVVCDKVHHLPEPRHFLFLPAIEAKDEAGHALVLDGLQARVSVTEICGLKFH